MKTGVVLAGGSLKGNYNHTGFLIALEELGIDIDAIIGTSAGAIIGGYKASGGSLKRLREIFINLKAKNYVDPISSFYIGWKILHKFKGLAGYIKGKRLEKYIEQHFPCKFFEETPIPFYAHTVNVSRRKEEIFHKGELAKPIRASASIPFIFQPVKIKDADGRDNYYLDGGVVGYNAVEELAKREPSLDVIIVNDFHKHNTDINNEFLEKPWTPYYLTMRLLDCQAAEFDILKYEVLEKYNVEVITIRPNVPFHVELTKPSPELAKKVIDYSIEETKRCFRELNKMKKSNLLGKGR